MPAGRDYDHIERIRLSEPGNSSFPSVGQVCRMTGWGCTRAGNKFLFFIYFVPYLLLSKGNPCCPPTLVEGDYCNGFVRPSTHPSVLSFVRPSVTRSCIRISSYSFQRLFIKISRYCSHDLKMIMLYRGHAD